MSDEVDIYDALAEQGLYGGRMLSGSKSGYRERFPSNTVYFNACVFNTDGTQVWHGDLDLSVDSDAIQQAVDESNEAISVTPEMPFRWNGLDGKQDRGFGKAKGLTRDERKKIVTFSPKWKKP